MRMVKLLLFNLPAIIQLITQTAEKEGALLSEDVAALGDALDSILKGFSDVVSVFVRKVCYYNVEK